MREKIYSATYMAGQINASPSSVLRALKEDPPRWTSIFSKLNCFVNSQYTLETQPSLSAQPLAEQISQLRARNGAASASATAALLRAVADLLENRAERG